MALNFIYSLFGGFCFGYMLHMEFTVSACAYAYFGVIYIMSEGFRKLEENEKG